MGEFLSDDEHSTWFYLDGRGVRSKDTENSYVKVCRQESDGVTGELEPHVTVHEEVPPSLGAVPVAVLIDRGTASSGEATAIAFEGRPKTRFFGEHTWGVTAVNEDKLLDGAVLHFAAAVEADRTGKRYTDGIDPDEKIESTPTATIDDRDPAVAAALRWLSLTSQSPTSRAGG